MATNNGQTSRSREYKATTPEGMTLGHVRWCTDAEALSWVDPMTRNPARAVVLHRYDSDRECWDHVAKVGSAQRWDFRDR